MKSLLKSFCLALCLLAFVSCSAEEPDLKVSLTVDEKEEVTESSTKISSNEDTEYPFYLTTMSHLEENLTDDVDEAKFNDHTENIRWAIALADQYGAKLTFESERPFAQACMNWGVNVLQEILDAGHGVGTHCDRGGIGKTAVESYEELVSDLAINKGLVDQLIGEENNLGCSGAGSNFDWVLALTEVGFKYVDGVVSMHYMSMPLDARPDGYTDQYIKTGGHHENSPIDLYDRIYPRLLADALDFEHDDDGELVLLSGGLGKLLAQDDSDGNGVAATTSDVDALVELLREINENRDKSQVAKVDVYFSPVRDLAEKNAIVVEYFFQEMEKLVEEGIVVWATQAEVYQAYIDTL